MKAIVLGVVTAGSLFATTTAEIVESMKANRMEHQLNQKILQKEYKQMLEANAKYYQNIYRSARKYYGQYLARDWGEDNVVLSDKKSFTQYDESLKARQTVDFEKGKVTIEIVTDVNESITPEVFEKKLDTLKKETVAEASAKDPVNKLADDYMKKKKIVKADQADPKSDSNFVMEMLPETKVPKTAIKEKIITTKEGKKKKIVSVEVPMVPDHLEKRANRFKPDVMARAKQFGLEPSYIFGVIQTESYFNPLAVSPIPAYGLMQIVPTSAGMDAYIALKGKKRLLPPAYLYDPENNIELGGQYLNIIRTRYLRGVKDPRSLDYCTATAYNAGIGNLYRSFSGKKSGRKEAIAKINSMSSDEVYEHLRTSPALVEEAHNYVKRVDDYKKNYLRWDMQQ